LARIWKEDGDEVETCGLAGWCSFSSRVVDRGVGGSAGSARNADVGLLRIGGFTSFGPCGSWLTNEQLMLWSPKKGKIEPRLAQSVKQPNPFVYIFTLRKGVKWHDGTELTAEDVTESLNFRRHPTQGTAFNFTAVRDFKATGRYTVQLTLKRRDGAILARLSAGGFAPIDQKAFMNRVGKDKLARPDLVRIGTGPWKLDSCDATRGASSRRSTATGAAGRTFGGSRPNPS
jgi:ABC-type transport system substrate-binding protein